MPQSQMTGIIRFGNFEVEPQTGVLRKHGIRVRLQEQPFRVLLALLEKPGAVVTREELRERLWSGASFGDFDHSLNIAVNKIREALSDSAETPRFVETLPRRGYRFIAPVESPAAPERAQPAKRQFSWTWIFSAGAVVVAIVVLGMWILRPPAPPELQVRRLTNDRSLKLPPVLSDGSRLYFDVNIDIAQIPMSGGEPARLPLTFPVPGFFLLDITPDGQELLLRAFDRPVTGMALWAVRIADGSSRRVGNLAGFDAAYSPDGRRIAFTTGGIDSPGALRIATADGSPERQLVELKGVEITTPVWSPDGERIAFAQRKRASQESSAWEIEADGTHLHKLFPNWPRSHLPAAWTPDGRFLLLLSQGEFWAARARSAWWPAGPALFHLTSGEPRFFAPIRSRGSWMFHAVGVTPLGELQRLDVPSRSWVPHLGGISINSIEYSRDGQRLAYVTHPAGELWVRFADGSRPVQLTKEPMQALVPRWSPDGKLIAFMGKSAADQPWRLHVVEAAGGIPRLPCPNNSGAEGDLTWAPDGRRIVYGAAPISTILARAHTCGVSTWKRVS